MEMGEGIKKVSGVHGGDISRNHYGLSHVRSLSPNLAPSAGHSARRHS
jgi:hypothetical protein